MLEIHNKDGILLVDSRLVADALGIQHESFMRTIHNYETEASFAFGVFRFEIGKPQSDAEGGRPTSYALLTEDQAIFLMTLSRNTPQVVQAKLNLVKAFSTAKEALKAQQVDLNAMLLLIQEMHQKLAQQEQNMNVLTERTQRLDRAEQDLAQIEEASIEHPGCAGVIFDDDDSIEMTAAEFVELKGIDQRHTNTLSKRAANFQRVGKNETPSSRRNGRLLLAVRYLKQAAKSVLNLD
jgi:phage regulator Rha-like protein